MLRSITLLFVVFICKKKLRINFAKIQKFVSLVCHCFNYEWILYIITDFYGSKLPVIVWKENP